MEYDRKTEKLRLLIVDESSNRRCAYKRAFAPLDWEVRCVTPEQAHAVSTLLRPHATLVAYRRAEEGSSTGALLRAGASLKLVPQGAVDRLVDSASSPAHVDVEATRGIVDMVRRLAAA